ncbi:MAG: hypothetical protein E4G99_01200 [Anaerolineales bacterium]|nr:MAG: hypothetical protein E4G99_01200 [Anaerolineales bacterium]
MAPIVHGLEAKYNPQVRFTYLDIDDPETETFQRGLQFSGFRPHIFLLGPDGEVLQEWIGYTPVDQIEPAIQEAIS